MKLLKTNRDVFQAVLDGFEVEYWDGHLGAWVPRDKFFFYKSDLEDDGELLFEHRIKPTKPSIDWEHVSKKYNWLARDKTGLCFLYEDSPKRVSGAWIGPPDSAFTSGTFTSAEAFESLEIGTCDWRDSLVERPRD